MNNNNYLRALEKEKYALKRINWLLNKKKTSKRGRRLSRWGKVQYKWWRKLYKWDDIS